MNAVGVEIENPFGDDDNDLPIKKMMKRIELDTIAMLELRTTSDQAEAMEKLRSEKAEQEKLAQQKSRDRNALQGPPGRGFQG